MARGVSGSVISVEEASQFCGVGVQVEDQSVVVPCFEDLPFDVVDSRSDCLGGLFPDTIGVHSRDLCPRVTVNDPVGIDHGNNLESVAIVEVGLCSLGFGDGFENVGYNPLHHKAGSGLNGMLPSQYPHDLGILYGSSAC